MTHHDPQGELIDEIARVLHTEGADDVDAAYTAEDIAAALRPSVTTALDLDRLPLASTVVDGEGHVWWRHDPTLWACCCDAEDFAIWTWNSEEVVEDAVGGIRVVYAHTYGAMTHEEVE